MTRPSGDWVDQYMAERHTAGAETPADARYKEGACLLPLGAARVRRYPHLFQPVRPHPAHERVTN